MTAAWFAVYTQPLMEITASKELGNQGFEVFLPVFIQKLRGHRQLRGKPMKRALLPCYLFTRFDPDSDRWRSINGTRGVVRLICQGDIPIAVSQRDIDGLKAKVDKDGIANLDDFPSYYVNQIVRLTEGAFAGYPALFVGSEKGLLTLSIDILGQKVKLSVPEDQVTT